MSIENNLKEEISVKDVTSRASFSHWEFQRLFSSEATVPISRYLRHRRLSEALKIIKKSNFSIIDIALEFQFNSPDSFSRAFREFFDFSPSEWKKNDKKLCSRLLNPLKMKDLDYYFNKIQRVPSIKKVPKTLLLGKEINYISHFSDNSDCADKVVPLWGDVLPVLEKHPLRFDNKLYGLAYCENGDIDSQHMKYFASISISSTTIVQRPFKEIHFFTYPILRKIERLDFGINSSP